MKITRHVGVETQTGTRIALIHTILPNTTDCLVVYLDNLPQNLKEAFYHTLESQEGQSSVNLTEALSRQSYSDTQKSLLQNLHDLGFIVKKSIDDISMNPTSAQKIPLREVLIASGLLDDQSQFAAAKYNPHAHNAVASQHGESIGTANNLLAEADLLDQSAAQKREQAYRIAPSLRPGYQEEPVESIDLPKAPVENVPAE
jgi:hypothetical protein